MQTMTFGIYDTYKSLWVLCQFSEEQHDKAVTFCNAMNCENYKTLSRAENPKKGQIQPELIKRYEVRAKEGAR